MVVVTTPTHAPPSWLLISCIVVQVRSPLGVLQTICRLLSGGSLLSQTSSQSRSLAPDPPLTDCRWSVHILFTALYNITGCCVQKTFPKVKNKNLSGLFILSKFFSISLLYVFLIFLFFIAKRKTSDIKTRTTYSCSLNPIKIITIKPYSL